MLKILEPYIKRNFNHRCVLIEKRNVLTEYFLESVMGHGWEDVFYMDSHVVLMGNNRTKQIMLVGCTYRSCNKGMDGFSTHSTIEKTNQNLNIIILLEINFKAESSNMKVPEFIELNLNALIQYFKIIKPFKERIMKYERGNLTDNGINKFVRLHRNRITYQTVSFKENLIREKEKHYVC